MLKSYLCNFNEAYILVKGNITNAGNIKARVVFNNCAPLIKCTTKIDLITIDDGQDLDLVMSM